MPLRQPRVSGAIAALSAVLAAAALAACVAAGPAGGRPGGAAGAGITCAAGFKQGVVAGKLRCLRPGRRCSAALQADYLRSGLSCRAGRLRARPLRRVRAIPGGATSRANPVPLGRAGDLGNGWTMTVSSVQLDARSALLLADPGNGPPPAGFQYVLVSVTASFNGADASHLNSAAGLRATGASNANYSMYNSYCGALPAPNLDLDNPLVFSGGTVSGYAACWSVPKEEVPSLVMYYQPILAKTRVWFALR
jgi:hypothetical protein